MTRFRLCPGVCVFRCAGRCAIQTAATRLQAWMKAADVLLAGRVAP